ncbi:PREDICTED: NADPH-dependent diflavin oxidoreductase 1-like [Polistes canadensis]|uniref:NADPH-dependent diflavin oxidoreductase 1-like n=1 Tax=Polistes canadensis TaxID=91411 RepID=UPI000718AC41|nr:PREDICTED: NADPH-dependent diflavin oxidoreductase 1-like [Polistes canadensis]
MNFSITILYASETGTAQDVAEQIWKRAKRKGLNSMVSALDDYDLTNFGLEDLMVFVVATTGQGDPPDNMKQFWRFLLRKSLPPSMLSNVRYGVIGLGDSSYKKFNFAAKKLNKRLAQLGGIELLPIGLADDQHDLGIDAVLTLWVKKFWEKIASIYNIPEISIHDNVEGIIERYKVTVLDDHKEKSLMETAHYLETDIYTREMDLKNDMKIGTVIDNIRTTAEDHFQDVRLIKILKEDIIYEPGDIIYVRPKNSLKQIEKFFNVLNDNNILLYPDMIVQVSKKEIKVPYVLRQTLTLGEIVAQYWDLSYKPRRSTFEVLHQISENDLEKEKLHEFTIPSGQEELYNYVNRPRRNIIEVLADFPHTTSKLNIQILFEIMSPIKPRAFSIASSMRSTKNEIHILVAVVNYKTKILERRLGLCSNWLANLKVNSKIIFWIRKGTFIFPSNVPKILIGPGTGIAPFRSLLLEEAATKQDLSTCLLFFGCRYKEKDYHCKEDFINLARTTDLKLFSAFSRDQEDKIYVQHIIRENKSLCWEFLQNGANIYLAGSSKNMPNNVRDEFIDLIKENGKFTYEEAVNFIENLEKNNRYQSETCKKMAGSYTKKEIGAGPEEQTLLKDSNGARIVPAKGSEPVRLSPGWEGTGRPDDELNFKGVTMDQADLEINPPSDRLHLVFSILVLHGIGILMPWNMFITAKDYFVNYKLSKEYTDIESNYSTHFLSYLGFASQIPNLLFNWLNIFMKLSGNLTTRIAWSIFTLVLIFVFTVILAMTDSSKWPGVFFWITMISVVVLNTANGIYQNSVFGMAAKLPSKYTGAVILGSNICGTFTASLNLVSQIMAPNARTAAIYYFITALFILLACFDTYFALPLNRFYRYHELLNQKELNKRQLENSASGKMETIPYWKIVSQCAPQLLNIFLVFFVTLTLFPAVQSDIKVSNTEFIIPPDFYVSIMCFLTFNITAMIGSSIASIVQWPSEKYLIIPIILRIFFIPLFLFCNYQPAEITRYLPVFITNDWGYLVIGITMGISHGYFSSIAMMYCPKMVDPQYSSVAGMFGAALLITGIFTGVLFSFVMPMIIS